MRVIIAGSRTITYYAEVVGAMMAAFTTWGERLPLRFQHYDPQAGIEIVLGGARGVDRLGLRWALEHGVPHRKFPANWDLLGKRAGVLRNEEMARYAAGWRGALVLVWDGESRGSADMLRRARSHGLRIFERVVR